MTQIPTKDTLKTQAKRMRETMAKTGTSMTHSAALELIAKQWGYRDWNAISAAAPNEPIAPISRWQIGGRVYGRYLGHKFDGRIKGVREMHGGHWQLTIKFDAAVDVVTSQHFTNLRRQVDCVINGQGVSIEATSDGTPHMVLFAAHV